LCCFNDCFGNNFSFLCGSIRACDHRRFRCGFRSRFWNYRSRNFLCRRFFCLSRRLWSRFWSNLRFRFRSRWQWFRVGNCDGLIYGWWLLYRNRGFLNRYRSLLCRRWRLFYRSWRLGLYIIYGRWNWLWCWFNWRLRFWSRG
jgi:hypothetical protein